MTVSVPSKNNSTNNVITRKAATYALSTERRSTHRLYSTLALAISAALIPKVQAEDAPNNSIEHMEVHGQQMGNHGVDSLENRLKKQGVDFSAAGGVSALPVLNGMMGDRIKVLVDGSDITASCANQMNPPLSYISANQVVSTDVIAGVSPVSAGGDNIAGVIKVNSLNPVFNESDTLTWHGGDISTGYRSVSDALLVGANLGIASKNVSLNYQGAFEDANSYKDGNGDTVLDTLYQAQNHALTAAWRDDNQEIAAKLTYQYIPYQGFANQYMDMTDNTSYGALVRYKRQLVDDGEFNAQLNWHRVSHEMGFFTQEKPGMMPMETEGSDYSYQLHWRLPQGKASTLLLGQEFYAYQLDDIWPAVPGSMMMGPNDYININNGQRKRAAVYAEWQQDLTPKWWISAGVRYEHVSTNTGEVQAYNTMSMPMMGMGMPSMTMPNVDADAADAFNAMDRQRSDNLIDATLLARYQLSQSQQIELGLARKNRAPNLYERYSWGRGTMATTMIGWNGDGNGYVGNPTLSAETAHTISAEYQYNDGRWQASASAWYSAVSDYIDAEVIGSFNTQTSSGGRNILQFTNLDATLYGSRFNAAYHIADSGFGKWQLNADVNITRGERDEGNEPLYQIKPLETELSLSQEWDNWQNSLVWQWIGAKEDVDARRLENQTDSYSLLNLNSRLQWQDITLTFAINNLLDEAYELPLGGVNLAEYKADNSAGYQQMMGAGRSIDVGISYAF